MCISDAHALHLRPRRGLTTPALLVTIAVAVLLAVAAIDVAQLSYQRQQLQNGADAAALAATAQVMDRRWLYRGVEGANTNDSTLFGDIQSQQLQAAEDDAIKFAALNEVASREIVLDSSDIVFGFVADPAFEEFDVGPGGSPVAGPDGGFNTLIVSASRRKAAGDLPLLWMARQVGLSKLEMVVTSQAAIDQRIIGFQPLPLQQVSGLPPGAPATRIAVPMLPFAVVPNEDDYGDMGTFPSPVFPQHLWWSMGPQDDFKFDEASQKIIPGTSDGIAEMVLKIKTDDAGTPSGEDGTRQGALIGFPPELNEEAATAPYWINWFSLYGLEFEDFPNGLTIGTQSAPKKLPAVYTDSSGDLQQICSDLLTPGSEILGSPRILPVINEEKVLLGFVAGRIVHCEIKEEDSDGESLLLVVQPCLLQTPTAVVGGDAPRNPWIGKLLLNR